LIGEVDKEASLKFKKIVDAEVQRTLREGVRENAFEIMKVQ